MAGHGCNIGLGTGHVLNSLNDRNICSATQYMILETRCYIMIFFNSVGSPQELSENSKTCVT